MTDNDPQRNGGDLRAAPSVPVRYRLAPLFGLVALGLVPVAALAGLLMWSDAVADEYEASESVQAETFEPSTEPTPALTTSVLDLRRAPADLARIGAANQLADALEQLEAFIDGRSCLAVSIDGRAVSSWNGDVPVIPASTNKLLVGGVAIEVLGADFRFTTSVAAPAPVDGVVEGISTSSAVAIRCWWRAVLRSAKIHRRRVRHSMRSPMRSSGPGSRRSAVR